MSKIRIFVGYSRKDDLWVREGNFGLIPWLAEALKRENAEFWYDPKLGEKPGVRYREEIEAAIDRTHFAVLLLSQDFIISDFIREIELPRIRERVDKKQLSIIPIMVGPVVWEGEEEYKWLSELQIIPGKPTPLVDYIGDPAKWKRVQVEILAAVKTRIREFHKKAMLVKVPEKGTVREGERPAEIGTNAERKSQSLPTNDSERNRATTTRYFTTWLLRRRNLVAIWLGLIGLLAVGSWTVPRMLERFHLATVGGAGRMMLIIVEPGDGAEVPNNIIVKGRISHKRADLWVVVHPKQTNEYWVQPGVVTEIKDEKWRAQANIGRPGPVDIGKKFEIMAIANPEKDLKEGDVFESWPKAQWQSQVIEVTRK